LVVGYEIGYTIGGWYHCGINMRGSGVSHLKNPINGFKGGSLGEFPPGELLLDESPGYPPSNG
jgi:hypothetical protein